ncbi:MAG: hypothetical protein ACYCZV_06105 [Acidimicrobiales bacterium]
MRQRWMSQRALLFHLAVLVVAPGCLIAFWWQLHRALGGNDLSWAYCFEWPIFSVLAVVGWWQLIHDGGVTPVARSGPSAAPTREPVSPLVPQWRDDPEDQELAAYNRWLGELASSGRRKTWRR